jgi:hypothetical protein
MVGTRTSTLAGEVVMCTAGKESAIEARAVAAGEAGCRHR